MKIKNLIYNENSINNYLKMTDYENFLNVVIKDNKYLFNLNSNIYFFIDGSIVLNFVLKTDMHWPTISYQIYGTPRLAWFLYKINQVNGKNIFKIKKSGDVIKYIDLNLLLSHINALTEDE